MRNISVVFIVVAMCLCIGSQAWANLLSNGDFELPGIEIDPATDWTHGGTAVGWNYVETNGFAGDVGYGMHLVIGNGSACDGWAYQDVVVEAGSTYQLSFDVGLDGWQSPACAGRIQFLDSGDAVISESSLSRDPAQLTAIWVNYSFTVVAPIGTVTARVQMENIGTAEGTFRCDNVVLDVLTHAFKITSGLPNGGFTNPAATTAITWTNPTNIPDQHEIYFVESVLDEPNALIDLAALGSPTATIAGTLETYTVGLTEGKYYAWRVISDSVGGYASSDFTFNTVNTAPAVDAGVDQNAWLVGDPSGTVDVDLDGTVSDADGYPGTITNTWTQTIVGLEGNVSGTIVANGDDATVTITTADIALGNTFTFQLEGDDGVDSATDTVTITVYAEADDRLIARWSFDGDLDESVDAAVIGDVAGFTAPPSADFLTGTAGGTNAIAYSNGVAGECRSVGQALSLDGTNYVEIAVDPNYLHFNNEITVSAWVKAHQTRPGSFIGLVAKGDSSWRLATNGAQDSAEFAVGFWQDEDFITLEGVQTIDDGNWHQVTGSYNGAVAKIYIDGYLDKVTYSNAPIDKNDFRLRIGGNAETNNQFNGDIDEVQIFDKGLSDARVLELYASGGGAAGCPPVCGQNYADSDFNQDCKTDDADLLLLIAEWLSCTDITGVNCDN